MIVYGAAPCLADLVFIGLYVKKVVSSDFKRADLANIHAETRVGQVLRTVSLSFSTVKDRILSVAVNREQKRRRTS